MRPDLTRITAAATRAEVPRVPFRVGDAVVGSIALEHLPMLADFHDLLALDEDAVRLAVEPETRDAAFGRMNAALRDEGLIVAWRDETFPLFDPATLDVLARFERAACRFWGTLTLGAHANGYVAGADGRPEALWIAQRSFSKPTDPGLHDNIIGGGVPHGQSPDEALVREGHEEAGLSPTEMAAARRAGVLRLARDIPEGFQHEWLHAYDLPLPAGRVPRNVDGEVAGFALMPLAEAVALAASGRMTVDAALVTLDFVLRHGLVDDPAAARAVNALRVVRPG